MTLLIVIVVAVTVVALIWPSRDRITRFRFWQVDIEMGPISSGV